MSTEVRTGGGSSFQSLEYIGCGKVADALSLTRIYIFMIMTRHWHLQHIILTSPQCTMLVSARRSRITHEKEEEEEDDEKKEREK